MQILVNVLDYKAGFFPNGTPMFIPIEGLQIVGMYSKELYPCMSDEQVEMLKIIHPVYGAMGIDETEQTLSDKINAAMCCDATAQGEQLEAPVIGEPEAGPESISIPFTLVEDATSYQFQASTNNFVSIAGTGTSTGTPASITGLTEGVAYKVRMRAIAPGFTPSEWVEAVGTFTPTAPSVITPAAPTGGVVDDTANTFAFTPTPGYLATAHEYNLNGAGYVDVTANPIVVGDINVAIGALLVRVKAVPGVNNASATLSNATAFTVAAPSTFDVSYGYSATDPYVDDFTAPVFTQMGTLTPALGANISVPFHDMPTLNFSVVEYDATESTKTTWFNTPFNNGTIPDSAQRAIFTVAGKKYIVARNAITYDPSPANPVVFS